MKKQLKDQLQEIKQKITECGKQVKGLFGSNQTMESGLEAEKLQREVQEAQVNEEEVKGKIGKVRGEIGHSRPVESKAGNGTKLWRSLAKPQTITGKNFYKKNFF